MGFSRYLYDQKAEAPQPQKYELPEEDKKAGWIKRISVGLLTTGVFVLLKEVLFGSGKPAAAQSEGATIIDPGNGLVDPPSLAVVETPAPEGQSTPEDNPSNNGSSASFTSASSRSFFIFDQPIIAEPVYLRTNTGRPLAASNDNEPAAPAVGLNVNDLSPQVGSNVGKLGSSDTLGAFDGAPNTDDDTSTGNRAPVVTSPARLKNLLANQTLIIATASLLQYASDADGDVLSVQNLVASSGNLVDLGNGDWSYTPDLDDTTDVIFTYEVSDGTDSTPQTALLDLLPIPGETIIGTDNSETIIGTPYNDVINANGGNDNVFALEGDDTIDGGDGNDRILAGEGDDVIFGGGGDDVIFGGGGNDVIFGGSGNDTIFGGDGDDILLGEDGQDIISAGAGDDVIEGGADEDLIEGDGGDDVIVGGSGSDEIDGGEGDDQIIATISDGDDTYSGGAGTDTYDFSATQADAIVDLAAGTAGSAQTGSDSLSGFENIISGSGDDMVTGNSSDNVIVGGPGSDEIDGGEGDDQIIATISDGNDTYSGGAGTDTYDLSATQADAIVDLAAGTAGSAQTGFDSLSGIENVTGGSGDDVITGNSSDNVIVGGPGSDEIDSGEGNDQIIATISDGNDTYSGGAGTDTYDLSAVQADVVVDLAAGTADSSETGSDSLTGIENITGGSGDDTLIANELSNVFTGGEGNDIFKFGSIFDGNSAPVMRDIITDFQVGDKIDVSGFDTNWQLADNEDFELVIDKLDFSDSGKVYIRFEGFGDDENTVLEGQIDESGEFVFEIELEGHYNLTKEDFIGVS